MDLAKSAYSAYHKLTVVSTYLQTLHYIVSFTATSAFYRKLTQVHCATQRWNLHVYFLSAVLSTVKRRRMKRAAYSNRLCWRAVAVRVTRITSIHSTLRLAHTILG